MKHDYNNKDAVNNPNILSNNESEKLFETACRGGGD